MRRKCLITPLIAIASLAAATSCWSADPPVPPIPSIWPVKEASDYFGLARTPITSETQRLVNDLTAPDFAIRARASTELKEKGTRAFPGLHDAVLASNDPELLARAGDLFWDNTIHHLQHIPTSMFKPISRYATIRKGQPSQVDLVLRTEMLPDESSVLLLRLLLENETNPSLRAALQKSVLNVAPAQARLQLLAGNWEEAEHILRAAVPLDYGAPADYAALVALRHGPEFDSRTFLQGADLNALDPAKRGQLAYYLYRAQGNLQAAADAELTFQPETIWRSVRPTLIECGRYADLAKSIESSPGRERYFFNETIAYSLAGDTARADHILDGIIQRPDQFETNNYGNVIVSLIKADRAEAAIRLAQTDASQQPAAFRLLCAQWRFREAFALAHAHPLVTMEIPRIALELGFKSEAGKLVDAMALDDQSLGTTSTENLSLIANVFDALNETKRAAGYRNRAFALIDHNKAILKDIEHQRLEIQKQSKALEDQAAAADPRQRALLQRQRLALQRTVPNPPMTYLSVLADPHVTTQEEFQLASFWMNRTIPGDLSTAETFEDVQKILRGTCDADRLVLSMTLPDANDGGRSYELQIFVKTLDRVHRRDLAKELLVKWSDKFVDPTCLAQLGDWALDDGHLSEAVQWYRKAAMLNLTDASLMYRLGVACSRIPANAADGRALIAFAPILVLGDLGQAQRLWTAMRQYEGNAAADHWYDEYMDRFCGLYPETMAANHTRKRDAAEARGDYAAALRFAQQLLFTPDQSLDEYSRMASAMLGVAAYHRSRALDAWSRKDFPTLADALWRQMDNGPPDPDLLERTGPALRLADHAAFLRILHRALLRVEPITQDYPALEPYSSTLTRLKALDI
jgi:hypothetical protein